MVWVAGINQMGTYRGVSQLVLAHPRDILLLDSFLHLGLKECFVFNDSTLYYELLDAGS